MFSKLPGRTVTVSEKRETDDVRPPVRFGLHSKGFLVLTDNSASDSLTSIDLDPNVVSFHGNQFSFDQPKRKHQKEYQSNLSNGISVLQSLGLSTLELEKNKPLRRHSDTIFFPVSLQENASLYIYPWTSKKNHLSTHAPKIKEFVMTNCLFGASILGIDDQGNKYPLIDHNLEIEDIITKIVIDHSIHPYETMSFAALQGLCPLLKNIGNDDFVVRYHLPVIDYMLYGVHLYISGKIAFDALENFIEMVKERGEKHKRILLELARKEQIIIHIESPFDNLFPKEVNLSASKLLEQLSLSAIQIDRMKKEHPKFSHALSRTAKRGGHRVEDFKSIIDVLNTLDEFISSAVSHSTPTNERIETSRAPRELFEELCIENVLCHLVDNTEHPKYQLVWRDIIEGGEINRFSPLQQLFKVANVAFIAHSRLGLSDFEVCSLLPIDEKPIAQAYADLLASRFGHILCLSWFPPLLNYIDHEELTCIRHHKNNLFRLRVDLLRTNSETIRAYLTDYFKLPGDFWNIVDNIFSPPTLKEVSSDKDPGEKSLPEISVHDRNHCGLIGPHTLWQQDSRADKFARSQSAPPV